MDALLTDEMLAKRPEQLQDRLEALQDRLEALHEPAFAWALACTDRRPEEAAEVLQEAYLKILGGQAVHEGRSTLRTFLFGVIRNTAREHRRRRRGHALAVARWAAQRETPPSPDRPDGLLAAAERRARLTDALGRLPRRQRDLLHLLVYEDLTLAEAAAVLGLRPGTASTHYARGKRRLRRLLESST